MAFRTTDRQEPRDGAFSAVSFAAVRIAPICIASDAIIGIIISKAAR